MMVTCQIFKDMDKNEIIKIGDVILGMSCAEQGILRRYVERKESLKRNRRDIRYPGEFYRKKMIELLGVDPLENTKSRLGRAPFYRCVLEFCLYEEGYSLMDIGRYMGFSHSTIHYNINRLRDMMDLPKVYTWEVSVLNQFNNINYVNHEN